MTGATGGFEPVAAAAPAVPVVAPVGDSGVRWRRRLAVFLMVAYAVLMFVPFLWSIVTSFKTLPDSVQMTFLPNPFTTAGWEFAFNDLDPPLPVLFLNSTAIAAAVTLTNLVLGSMAGYAFARLRFPGREVLFLIVLATLMIPDQLRLVPVYLMLNGVGLTRGFGQYIGLVTVMAISGTSIFFMRQYFLTIPRDLEEAARMDGAGFFTTFLRVMLPLAGPALATIAVLTFQGTWNSFFWPLVILGDTSHRTLPLGLAAFRLAGGFTTNWPPQMATIVMATVPILVLYLFFQRYFVPSVAKTGLTG